jgi:hypothetical protein
LTRAARTSNGGKVDAVFGAEVLVVVTRGDVFFWAEATPTKIAAKIKTDTSARSLLM